MKIVQAGGQTCNQFWIYSNYIADALENETYIVILSPDISIKDYPNLLKSDHVKFPLYSKFLCSILGYKFYILFLQKVFANKYSLKFYKIIFRLLPFVSFIEARMGMYKSKFQLIQKENIKFLFSPDSVVITAVDNYFVSIKRKIDLIVGVHIRRGDYKEWMNGKYYYSDEEYHKVMLQMQKLFPNSNISFFISSNENIDITYFEGCSCFIMPESSACKDLYGLSISDYIIGPPSSFSGWASFRGDVPLYIMSNSTTDIKLDNFRNIQDYWSLKKNEEVQM